MLRERILLASTAAVGLALFASPSRADEAADLQGVSVVLVGEADGDAARSCRALAREVYKLDAIRPRLAEDAARALCGDDTVRGPASANGEVPLTTRLAELRTSAGGQLDNAAQRAVAEALIESTRSAALILVERVVTPRRTPEPGEEPTLDDAVAPDETPRYRVQLLHGARRDGRLVTRVDSARFDLSADGVGLGVPWADVASAALILTTEGASTSPLVSTTAPAKHVDPASIVAPPAPEKPTPFYESPWFWVAAGAVAAAGIIVIVVSQVGDVGQGTIHLSGKVPE
ncbi:MAG: hypothetical protein U0271_34580 [Polyangiaceae bacterium]